MAHEKSIELASQFKMSLDEEKTQRLQKAVMQTRESWQRQVNAIFKTRDEANFKRRHKSPDRMTTLMDLQNNFAPRMNDTLASFYEDSLSEVGRR
jgi:hypothetical protein